MERKIIELPEPKMTRARALAILRLRFTDAEIAAMVAGRVKITVKKTA